MKKTIHFNFLVVTVICFLTFPKNIFSQTTSLNKSYNNLASANLTIAPPADPVKVLWTVKHPFSRRVFIENKGQFDKENNIPEHKIKFGNREEGTYIYFSSNGLLFRHDELPKFEGEEWEELEESTGKKRERILARNRVITTIVNMEWVGCNPDAEIESEDKVSDYFVYGSKKANGFKKIIYKNIYPNIDVEYTMRSFEEGGMKYVIILHPGADPSVIKMRYSNVDKIKINSKGDIVIKSTMGDITDHAPKTFYEGGQGVESQFVLNENAVTFQLAAYDHSKTVVIDPTVTFPGTPGIFGPGPTSDGAFDVGYDNAGNMFVYGGASPFQVIKFNGAGTQQWTHSTGSTFGAGFIALGLGYGDFAVDPVSGRTYICEGLGTSGTGSKVLKLGAAGDSVSAFKGDPTFTEMWRMTYNGCIGKTIIAGSVTGEPTTGTFHAVTLDTSFTNMVPVSVYQEGDNRDMSLLALDDFGDAFMACSESAGKKNDMVKCPLPTLAPVWEVKNRTGFVEPNVSPFVGTLANGYNGIAVNPSMLYVYDGARIVRWNKATGMAIDSLVVKAGAADYKSAGIAVDNCGNMYVGSDKTIKCYDANYTLIQTIATPDLVYDLILTRNSTLVASGKAFVQTFSAIVCNANNLVVNIAPTNSCGGLGSAAATVTTGVPPYTYKWSTTPVQTTATAINLASGTYTVTVKDAACNPAIGTQTVTITSGAAVPVAGNSATICEGVSTTLTATGATTYSWSPATGLSASTGATVTATPTVTTTYTITGTVGGCTGTSTSTVTVNPLPIVSVNSLDVCTGQGATLTASGATIYSWLPTTDLSPTTGATVVASPTSAVNYTVTGTTNGCSASAVSAVTISTMPSSNAGADITICSGATGNLGAPLTVGYVYVWSPTTGLSSSTAADPTITLINSTAGTTTSSYTVTTSPAGCSSTDVVNVTVKVKDDASFAYNTNTVCKLGGSDPVATITGTTGGIFSCPDVNLSLNTSTGLITLAATPIGTYTVTYRTIGTCPDTSDGVVAVVNVPDAAFSYGGPYCQGDAPNALPIFPLGASAGTFTASPVGLVFISTSTGEVNLITSSPNTYTVINTIAGGGAGGCPSVSDTSFITINAIPVTKVDNQSACSGAPATLTASGATNYSWSDNTFLGTLTASPSATTSYTVTGTTLGCSSSAVGIISSLLTPTVTVNITTKTICEGDSVKLVAAGAASYTWTGGPGSSTNTLIHFPTTSTTYTVVGTTSGCSASAVSNITVNPAPVVTVNSPVVCQGQSATLIAGIVGSPGGTFIWIGQDTTFVNPKVKALQTTSTYTVFGTFANCSGMPMATQSDFNAFFGCFIGGCTNFATTPNTISTITVVQTPTITVNSPSICAGGTATLTANGGSTYTWSTGESGATINVNPVVSPTSYTVIDNTAGCSGSAVSSVTINNPPTINVNNATICSGQSAILTATGNVAVYGWSNGAGTISTTVSPLVPGLNSYTVTGNPNGGCSAFKVATVLVNPNPTITVNSSTICSGSTATLTANGATSYNWSNGTNAQSITVSPSAATTNYNVTGVNTFNCPSLPVIGTVYVIDKPKAEFTFSPEIAGILEPTITFTDQTSNNPITWAWDFGDGNSLSPTTQNPEHTYPGTEETYTVTLSVTNASPCPDTVRHTIIIGPEFTFFMPNAFSPNHDNLNDGFGAKGGGILKFQLLIFDRWGNQIFSADDINKLWDGKAKGGSEVAEQDVYVWKVRLTDVFKKEHNFIGTVTLLKGY